MTRVLRLVPPILAALLMTAGTLEPHVAQRDTASDLRNVFSTGYILQDRNGDDVIDFVNARIVIPANPSEADAVTAANVAARLGYETSATNLEPALTDTGRSSYDMPVVAVGPGNTMAQRADARLVANGLSAGEGAIVFLAADGSLRRGGVLITGSDATGEVAAGSYFSSRYPSIWALRGSAYGDVADRVTAFLDQPGLSHGPVSVQAIVIDANRRGVARVELHVPANDSATMSRAVAALEEPDSVSADSSGARGGGGGARAGGAGGARLRHTDLAFADLHRIDVRVVSGTRSDVAHVLAARPTPTRAGTDWAPRESPDFSLSDLYTINGLFRDTNQDLVPDRMEAHLSVHGAESAQSLAMLAERIGLETAGIRLPLADVGGQQDYPQDAGFPLVYGVGHYQTDRLIRTKKLIGAVATPGEGFIQFVPRAFAGRNGIVIGAPDAAGLDAITDYVAHRLPYTWDYGKGNPQLTDIENDVRKFVQVKDAPGQTALAAVKLGAFLDRLKGKTIDSLGVEIAAKEQYAGLEPYVDRMLKARFPAAKTSVKTFKTGFGVGKPIFTQDFTIPWEVDAFWKAFRADALPKLAAASKGRIEVRVSESPAMRQKIGGEIEQELRKKGIPAGAVDVQVLSAYKQGYSWLYDDVLPRLRGKPVGRVEITYHTLKDQKEVRWQVVESDTRWLQELYPIDATLARELHIADSMVVFTPSIAPAPIYAVRVLSTSGAVLYTADFDPTYVLRPFFDVVPEYEQIRVTTGSLRVDVGGKRVVDQRIKTDAESFWDVLQSDTYKRIADYLMDVQDGRPASANAPYFDEFRVDLTMSEPDYRLGVDEEVISSLEAMHEDIYFETLTLFNLIGGRYNAGTMDYAGRVIPMVHPSVEGKPGHARITFTGKERGVPQLVFSYTERGKQPVRDKYPLSTLPTDAPRLRGISVKAGARGLSQLVFDVASIDSVDKYEQLKLRGTEESIDRTFLPATLLQSLIAALDDLHRGGVAQDALSYDKVGSLLFRIALRDTLSTLTRTVSLARSTRPAVVANPTLSAAGYRYAGKQIVQWDTPIPPPESDSIMARLGTFPGVHVWYAGKSFLGKNIFAADFLLPTDARFVSQAKLNALKPTLLLSGRQHANEVSSTSHILRLGEWLVTDTSYTKLLKKVNVVLHPVTNPDGAQLAYDLQKVTPDFMLHAGYLGALGVDATSGGGEDAIYPESRVRPMLQEMWLPDIYMNLHGYPSHEWVQLFAGYSGWVRGRTGAQRQWWSPRGWFVPGFTFVEDARNPEWGRAQFAILDSVAAAMTGNRAVDSINKRLYARYQRYGKQDDENFREYFRNGILVYQSLRGRELAGGGGRAGGAGADPAAGGVGSPRVSYFSVTTESPDETARGDWLKFVGTAGITHTSALLRYLAAGTNDVRRDATEYEGVVIRSVARRKPVLPRR